MPKITRIHTPTKRPGVAPKMFTRKRTLDEVTALCKERHWPLNTELFDLGGDSVSFQFTINVSASPALTPGVDVSGLAVWNVVVGRITGKADNVRFSSDNTDHEGLPWFDQLLETVFA